MNFMIKLDVKLIPLELQEKLFEEYYKALKYYKLEESATSEISVAKFIECLIRLFEYFLNNKYTPFGTEIKNKDAIINSVINSNIGIELNIRMKVSKLCLILLDFRNTRDSAHIGSFKVNKIDALFMLNSINWIYAELIRVYSDLSIEEAQKLINNFSKSNYPNLISIDDKIFITDPKLSSKEEILILLSSERKSFSELKEANKDSNISRLRMTIKKLEKEKKICIKDNYYYILPEGNKYLDSINSK